MMENFGGDVAGDGGGDRSGRAGALRWGIKASLVDYVRGMADGTVEVVERAVEIGNHGAVVGPGAEVVESAAGAGPDDVAGSSGGPGKHGEAVAGFVFPRADAEVGVGTDVSPVVGVGTGAGPDAGAGSGARGSLRFAGTVTLTGHGGMLHLVFANPALEPAPGASAGRWVLTIDDPHEPGARLPFAHLATAVETAGGGIRGTGTVLTQDGADLFFFGPYAEGTELDDPEVLGGSEVLGDRDGEAVAGLGDVTVPGTAAGLGDATVPGTAAGTADHTPGTGRES